MTTPAEVRTPSVRWAAFVDGATDGLVVAFAGWTLVYQVFMATQTSMLGLGWPWLAFAVMVTLVAGLRSARGLEAKVFQSRSSGVAAPIRRSSTVVLLAVVGLLALMRERWGVTPLAVAAVVTLVAYLFQWWAAGRTQRAPEVHEVPATESAEGALRLAGWEHWFAAASSLGLGVLAALLLKPDADDAFYVNRATWVAEHGTAALGDTMFGPDTSSPVYAGGLPTPSVEAFQGVLAHALGMAAPTIAYLVYAPLLAVVFGWVTWRLIRSWAPRYAWLAFAVALLFVLGSAASVVGSYSVGRIWQGKVTAYAVLLPLAWHYLSQLAVRPRQRELWLLLAAGITFVGLTTTSALLAPVVAGAALVAAVALRSRWLALGAGAFLVGPLVNAAVQVFGPAQVGVPGAAASSPDSVFTVAFGTSAPMALVALIAVVFGAAAVRGRAMAVAVAGSLATLACLLPGLLIAAAAVTDSGPVIWRLAIAMPTWVLVGVLACAPWERVLTPLLRPPAASSAMAAPLLRRSLPILLPITLALTVLFAGKWLWSPSADAQLTSRPTWKVAQPALTDVRAALRLPVGRGLWLLPPEQMEILAISTAGPYAVVPRGAYLPGLDVSAAEMEERRALLTLVAGYPVPPKTVAHAMDELDVALACVPLRPRFASRTLAKAVGEPLRRVGDMRCHVNIPRG